MRIYLRGDSNTPTEPGRVFLPGIPDPPSRYANGPEGNRNNLDVDQLAFPG